MPRLSSFYGIVIYRYFVDHNPLYFHAIYGEHQALVGTPDGGFIRGTLPRTANKLVQHWPEVHREELEANWRRAQIPDALEPIKPLD